MASYPSNRMGAEDDPLNFRNRLDASQVNSANQAAQTRGGFAPEPPTYRPPPLANRLKNPGLNDIAAEQAAGIREGFPKPPPTSNLGSLSSRLNDPSLINNAASQASQIRTNVASNQLGARIANPNIADDLASQSAQLRNTISGNRAGALQNAAPTLKDRLTNSLQGAYENASSAIERSPTGFAAAKEGYVNPAIESAKNYLKGQATQRPAGLLNTLKDVATGPAANFYLGDQYNQGRLENDLATGNVGVGTGLRGIFSLASRAAPLAAQYFTGSPQLRPELQSAYDKAGSLYQGAKDYVGGLFDSQGNPVQHAQGIKPSNNNPSKNSLPTLDEKYIYNVDGSQRYAPLNEAPRIASQNGVSLAGRPTAPPTSPQPSPAGLHSILSAPSETANVSRDKYGNLVDSDGTIYAGGYDTGNPNQGSVTYENGSRAGLASLNGGKGARVLPFGAGGEFYTGGNAPSNASLAQFAENNGLPSPQFMNEEAYKNTINAYNNQLTNDANNTIEQNRIDAYAKNANDRNAIDALPTYGNLDGQLMQTGGSGAAEFNNRLPTNRGFDPRKFDPAFNDEALSSAPQNTPPNEIQRLRSVPKNAWAEFNNDYANSKSDQERKKYLNEFAKDSGISPDVVKSLLFRSPSFLY